MVFGNAHNVGTLPNELAFGQIKKHYILPTINGCEMC